MKCDRLPRQARDNRNENSLLKPKNDGWICVRRDATCVGSDDGTGADCALNDDGTSCEVLGGDCVFSAAVAGVDAEILKAAVVGVCAVWIGFMCVRAAAAVRSSSMRHIPPRLSPCAHVCCFLLV